MRQGDRIKIQTETLPNTLFHSRNGADIRDVIRHVEGELQKHVDGFDQRKFDSQPDEEVVRADTEDRHRAPRDR